MEYPWDLSLPQQLPPLDDEADFLNILSKQINSSAIISNAHSNPQAVLQLSPPLSEDSSPSPPAPHRGLTQDPHNHTPAPDSGESRDDMLKRKVQDINSDDDDDDIEGQPQLKSQRDQSKKSGNRRKSGADESRLQKRKEQNRAAQRAFRERKEKHVKDLEDKVAALEAKTSTQAAENDNLRDLLGRLQNENLMLKQSAFTFSIPGGGTSTNNTNNQGGNNTQRSSGSLGSSPVGSSSNKSGSPGTASLSSARESPSSGALGLGAGNNNNGTGFTPLLSFSSLGTNGSKASSTTQNSTTNPPSSTSSSNSSLPLTSFFSPPPNLGIQSPYTTIASNPLFTSYTDMASWDQFVFGDMSGSGMDSLLGTNSSSSLESHNTTNNSSGGMNDLFSATNNYGEMIPFSSFSSGTSPTAGLNQTHNKNSPSVSPVAHAYNTSMPSFSQHMSTSNNHTTALPASFGQYRSSSPCGGADPDQAPLPGSAHHQPNRTIMPINGTAHGDGKKCPSTVAEMEAHIRSEPISTFGSIEGGHSPSLEKKPGQMEMGEVWRKIKEHPEFEDIDIDNLCQELSQKARCDGTRLVMDSDEKSVCKEIAKTILKAKQQQAAKNQNNDSPRPKNDDIVVDQDTPSPATTASATSTATPKSSNFTLNLPSTTSINTGVASDPLAMFNPFLPISFQQQMQNAAAFQQKQQNSQISPAGFGTFGSIPHLPPQQPQQQSPVQSQPNLGQQQQQQQQGQNTVAAGLPMNVSELPMDFASPGAFDSMMNFRAFSPSAFLAFDE